MQRKGLIQIYTGNGKGKTTAAVGLAIRALGHNLKVCYITFHKDFSKKVYGEISILKRIGVDVYHFAPKHPHFYKNVEHNKIREECLKALDYILKLYKEQKYHILILDEINISLRDGFLSEQELLNILIEKPERLEIVLTGRGATKEIIDKADLISEIQKIKHPYKSGIKRRKGIEY